MQILRESTGSLKLENAQLKTENEVLKRQIELYKKLASKGKDKSENTEENNEKVELNKEITEELNGKRVKKGKKISGLDAMITFFSIFAIIHIEERPQVNYGSRTLNFYEEAYGIKPFAISTLVVICGLLLNFMALKA